MLKYMRHLGYCPQLHSGDRTTLIDQIKDYQKGAEEGKHTPLIIYAEGGTTNGNLIKFQKGAFIGNYSIRPKACVYNTYGFVESSSGILDGFAHHVLIMGAPFSIIDVYDFPIFRPNDYFY